VTALLLCAFAVAADWAQFRGPNGSGVQERAAPPVSFDASRNVAWKVGVPFGRSSPILIPQGVVLTAVDGDRLVTLCLDRDTGKVKWRREVRPEHRHTVYKMNDGASPTPVSDGRNVAVFFPDFGLISYTGDGVERWRMPLGPFDSFYGMAGSPVMHGGLVYLVCDQRQGSFLIAVDAATGKVRWRADRSAGGFEGFSTPVVYRPSNGPAQLIVQGSFRIDAYSAASGERLWWVRRQGYNPKGVPVIAGDLLVASSPGSDEPQYPAFVSVLPTYDNNGDGLLSREEVRANADMYEHYGAMDANRDGQVDEAEYDAIRNLGVGDYGMVGIRLRSDWRGDVTEQAIVWREKRAYPNVPAPLHFRGVLFSVRNGGILATHDARTGKPIRMARTMEGIGDYYSSPVLGNGHVYFASEQGTITVMRAAGDGEIVAVNRLGDEIYATPAMEGRRLFVRTRESLFCFQE
jgi:outer membrane protein assembly factor BamB